MHPTNVSGILVENNSIESIWLQREVVIDCFLPLNVANPSGMSLLLINDGQNMAEMGFEAILDQLYSEQRITPIVCVAIHANENRRMEYGVTNEPDYLGRGALAAQYSSFIKEELLPWIKAKYLVESFRDISFAGFSLGGLSALDNVWQHPETFKRAGVFSGSLWWRNIDQSDESYDDDLHRIIHQRIRHGEYHEGMQFFFQCGNKDETKDRNNNGIIDSIDDTLDLIKELVAKGYDAERDISYLEMPDGSHDVPTWGLAMPVFLMWGWGNSE